ncbi:BA75_02352T0 [Komagataella pastoris]|uniref:BA75_02352T0 n=1 Tax=Komagataella pastoris TaxID=4922 RepID=A0A1B2JA69_PICPA|nr:BA75_02352T0 [Komagataella pastoris]
MGAVLSLPLASLSLIGSWISSFIGAGLVSGCLSAKNPLSKTFKSSVATRVMYGFLFFINSVMSWASLSHTITEWLERASWGFLRFGNAYCRENHCIGFTNVHRISLSLGILHLILAGLVVGVHSTSDKRAVIQNGYWHTKIFVSSLLLILSFMIPDTFFLFWGNYISIIFSTIFIGIGLILLVDFAHEWAETCIERIEEGEIYLDDDDTGLFTSSKFWRFILVGGTVTMYILSVGLFVFMYLFFAQDGCIFNIAAISLTFGFGVLVTFLSVSPIIQEYNSNAGLAQSSMCCLYCAYLTFSACLSEPDDKGCNPLIRSRGTRNLSIILGSFFTFIAVAYTTTRAAGNSAFSHSQSSYGDSHFDLVSDIFTAHPPGRRNELRAQAIRQAVEEGSLPESALNDPIYYQYDENDTEDLGEEKHFTKYNYFLFHIIFFLATQYVAALLTINLGIDIDDNDGGFIPVGRTYFNSWVKVISTWCCFALYGWSLVAPVLFPDRFYTT